MLLEQVILMTTTTSPQPATASLASPTSHRRTLALLISLWSVLFFASLFAPPVLDDADGTHANAARQMMLSGDWVTLRVNNVRYLEKAPLPYWIVAASLRVFGINAFAAHLPQALFVLLLMLLGVRWARESFGEQAALYTGLGVLTSAGVFLFTRVFLPDVLLSLLLACALYCLLHAIEGAESRYAYAMWMALALAVLTKGLVALVFFFATATLYLALTGELRNWRRLKPFSGALLFLTIAAPWHILAGLRNTGGMNGHGFFWFYFINEHVLRFLGRRIPMDYNKLPSTLYWSLHLVWLFPWALFSPLLVLFGARAYRIAAPPPSIEWTGLRYFFFIAAGIFIKETFNLPYLEYALFGALYIYIIDFTQRRKAANLPILPNGNLTPRQRTTLLLSLFSALVLIFFSLSTNQEYYTFPAYLPLLMLLSAALTRAEATYDEEKSSRRWITFAHAAFTTIGLAVAAALAYGLWTSRHLAFVPDIGELLAHRGVGDYTLSMSSLFDLTGPSFAALRLPASLALAAFAIGPTVAWWLRTRRRHIAATTALALTSAVFLVAAHIAFVRFRRKIWPPRFSSSNPPEPSRARTPSCSTAIRPTARRSPST
jgi:4-amino-4-deoxy-L-arabinose transferase-like glycosyltransferase